MNISLNNSIRTGLIIVLANIFFVANSQKTSHNIIPNPVSFEKGKGHFLISPGTRVVISPSSKELSNLAELLIERFRIYSIVGSANSKEAIASDNSITLILSEINELGAEGYKLVVDRQSVTITANSGKGIFYGIQTLFQLLPSEIVSDLPQSETGKWKVPACHIIDYPRFAYRGMHLDVCRHFFPVEFIKKYIDLMSQYKMNNFHWHLTDDQGWRLEIKKYPKLTEIGSRRSGTSIGRNIGNDNIPYEGFYTQAEAREIVAYAAKRYVNIIPEIEMPGHALAALAAYPELSCTGGPFEVWTKWGVTDDIYCVGNEQVFSFLEDILSEVMDIFPSKYIHIGGDEAPKTRWDACPKCQKRIKDEGLSDAHELQSYFIRRIEKFLNQNGRQIIGWDEILEGGLAPGATVMSWRGIDGGIQAAKMGHDVIMTPGSPCYFDHYQANPAGEPLAIGGYNPLKNVYQYDPVPESLSAKEALHILGSQGNVWTEYIPNTDHVEYMAYPRALAMAEVNWTSTENRNWEDFSARFNQHLPRLEKQNVNFSKSAYNVSISTVLDSKNNEMLVVLESDVPGSKIRYGINLEPGKTPHKKYKKPFKPEKNVSVSAVLEINKLKPGNITERTIYVHDAFGKTPKLNTTYSERYAAKGPITLTDGCRANALALRSDWFGFSGEDADILIDLGEVKEISNVNIGFLYNPVNWIFLPTEVIIELSTDGQNFIAAEGMRPDLLTLREPVAIDYNHVRINAKARYIRIIAKNRGVCPEGHPGAGKKAWLFLDEVMINQPVD
jgi:hexosaminidase